MMEITGNEQIRNLCGEIVRSQREKLGMSQEAFASAILVTKDELSALEKGYRVPDRNELILIGHLIHANPVALADGIFTPPVTMSEVEKKLNKLKEQLAELKEESMYIQNELRALCGLDVVEVSMEDKAVSQPKISL